MGTRATIHFGNEAIIYRHWDGYLKGLGNDIAEFIRLVDSSVHDKRFSDPSYLAAKWVVHDAERYTEGENRLEFLSVGIVREDPGDIDYRYHVDVNHGGRLPKLTAEDAEGHVRWSYHFEEGKWEINEETVA